MDRLGDLLCIKAGHQDDLSSSEHCRVHGNTHPKAVKERKGSQYPLLVSKMPPGDDLMSIGYKVKVRKHDALGNARGAAAINKHGHLVWLNWLWMPIRRWRLLHQIFEIHQSRALSPRE